jgi:hypothetical protein
VKRGTGLSRNTPLTARTPLRTHTGLQASAPWSRSVPLLTTTKSAATRKDTGPSRKVRALVLERDGHACVCCGRSVIGQSYSLQHRKRRSQGGDNSPANLVTVLGTGTTGCHERIDSRRDPQDEAKGYTVRSWQDPEQIPVMVFSPHGSGATAWLTEAGTYSFQAPEGAVA